jgi:Skp family chaperone for outer membrane proteins
MSVNKSIKSLKANFTMDKYFEVRDELKANHRRALDELDAEYQQTFMDISNIDELSIKAMERLLEHLNAVHDKFFKKINKKYNKLSHKLDKVYYEYKMKN